MTSGACSRKYPSQRQNSYHCYFSVCPGAAATLPSSYRCAQQHSPNLMMNDNDQIISRYTRAQAIEDGVLVDVSQQAKETGLLLPTVITDHLHKVLESIPKESHGQDYRGRLHDVLWMAYLKLRALKSNGLKESDFPMEFEVIIDRHTHSLWIDADGDGFTIMYPEDY